jgi:hypothetical protein
LIRAVRLDVEPMYTLFVILHFMQYIM